MSREFVYRVLAALPAFPAPSWAVLVFHRIVPDENIGAASVVKKLAMRLSDFSDILDWLAVNARVVSLDDGLAALAAKRPDDRRLPVSLTFDDGYQDNLTIAARELASRGMTGTFYVASDLLDGNTRYWWDIVQSWSHLRGQPPADTQRKLKALHGMRRREEIERMSRQVSETAAAPACLTRQEVRALWSLGMAVGNHTASHPELNQLAPREIQREIARAHEALAELLPVPPSHFAFPEGCVSPAADGVLETLGYRTAVTALHGRNYRGAGRWRLRRIDGRYLVGPQGFSPQRASFWINSGLGDLPYPRRA